MNIIETFGNDDIFFNIYPDYDRFVCVVGDSQLAAEMGLIGDFAGSVPFLPEVQALYDQYLFDNGITLDIEIVI